jgi:hypothetical protein
MVVYYTEYIAYQIYSNSKQHVIRQQPQEEIDHEGTMIFQKVGTYTRVTP